MTATNRLVARATEQHMVPNRPNPNTPNQSFLPIQTVPTPPTPIQPCTFHSDPPRTRMAKDMDWPATTASECVSRTLAMDCRAASPRLLPYLQVVGSGGLSWLVGDC